MFMIFVAHIQMDILEPILRYFTDFYCFIFSPVTQIPLVGSKCVNNCTNWQSNILWMTCKSQVASDYDIRCIYFLLLPIFKKIINTVNKRRMIYVPFPHVLSKNLTDINDIALSMSAMYRLYTRLLIITWLQSRD